MIQFYLFNDVLDKFGAEVRKVSNLSERCIAFDAYGTLFDVFSVGVLAEKMFPSYGSKLAEIWRVSQIDCTRLRTLSDKYLDFWTITNDALIFALTKLGLQYSEQQVDDLMEQYSKLTAFEENAGVLKRLRDGGARLAILSNGTPQMLESAVAAAGMNGVFEHILSVETVRKFKTAPQAYQLAPDAFGVAAKQITFVSSNGWDVCGATWFGFRTFWVNRAANVLEPLDVKPHGEGRSLIDLERFVG